MDLLQVKNLQVDFTLHQLCLRAVHDVSFRIKPSSTVALVGESGSGKTVCAHSIMGILPQNAQITGGKILFADPNKKGKIIDLVKLNPRSKAYRNIQGGRISIIFQEPMTALSPLHTIGNQILEAVLLHRDVGHKQALNLTKEILNLVGFPNGDHAYRTYPFELSGGMRQRAVIAMALVCHPALLIADEPTTALDVTIQAQILTLLKDLQDLLQMSILLITHDLGIVANLADELVVLYRGNVVESGPLTILFENPQHDYLKGLLNAVPRLTMDLRTKLIPLRSVKPKVGKLFKEDKNLHHYDEKMKPLLELKNLQKSYKLKKKQSDKSQQTVKALNNVSLTLKRGECLGLVGESGCGKTTLCKALMRAISLDQGDVTFYEEDKKIDVLSLKSGRLKEFRKKIQYIFQDPFSSLNPRMQVSEILKEPLIIHGIKDRALLEEVVVELMELVGLDPQTRYRYPHNFSGGQRQRIGVARALALHPDILVCDEPVSALDVSIQAQVLNLLKDLKTKLGLTYLFISHNIAVVRYLADEIAVMYKGAIVEFAPTKTLFENPVHPYTKSLLAAVPDPDLSNKLDFKKLKSLSQNQHWDVGFNMDDSSCELKEIHKNHYVRINSKFNERSLT